VAEDVITTEATKEVAIINPNIATTSTKALAAEIKHHKPLALQV